MYFIIVIDFDLFWFVVFFSFFVGIGRKIEAAKPRRLVNFSFWAVILQKLKILEVLEAWECDNDASTNGLNILKYPFPGLMTFFVFFEFRSQRRI